MKKVLACAALLAGFAGAAHAADSGSVKDAIPDGPITWMGVTFYGTVDVGYAYIHNGAYPSGAHYYGASYGVFSSPFNHREVSTLTNNALQLSNVGLKIEEQLGGGFLAIGKLETQFNPISGEIGDACASLLRFSGVSLFNQEKNGDGSRCGQAFNNVSYAGLSHPIYGTLTVGRQTSLVSDGMGVCRTPIREALTLLEQEGFVRAVPRRGIYVVRKSKKEICEMIVVWAALEGMAARLAATRATQEQLKALAEPFQNFKDEPQSDQMDDYSEANIAFHQAQCGKS